MKQKKNMDCYSKIDRTSSPFLDQMYTLLEEHRAKKKTIGQIIDKFEKKSKK